MKTSRFSRKPVVLIALSLLIGVTVLWLYQQTGPLNKEVKNVVLISIDTCRADHLSCYGYGRNTTPNIDRIARESILFTNAYSPVPLTLPAHGSMLTGTIPPYHGVHENQGYKLHESNVTLAEILRQNDYTTGAVISSFVLDSQFGLNQGFEYYNESFVELLKDTDESQRRGGEASRFAMEWLDENRSERFFLFLHYYDPHTAYEPPEPFASRFSDNLYAGEIAYTDQCIGQVLGKLKELGLYDSTLIIITGDHGEMLGEHGEETHSYYIYQSALRVPLVFKLPGSTCPGKIDDPAGIVDIVPTVCGILDIDIPPYVQGKDLSPYFVKKQRPAQDRELYCESLVPTTYDAGSLLGVINARYKYIQTTRPELYDLVQDPGETKNLLMQEPHRARILQDRLSSILEASVNEKSTDSKMELDEEGRKKLESLGYIAGAGVREDFEFDQSREDPKDIIEFHSMNVKAKMLIEQKEYSEAKKICEKMIQERPSFPDPYSYLADIAGRRGDRAGAVAYMTELMRLRPNDAKAHFSLGTALAMQGRSDEAIRHYSEALRINPDYSKAHSSLAYSLLLKGKVDEAIKHYKEALRINPRDATSNNGLGSIMFSRGEVNEAIRYYSEALRINPRLKNAHRNLGIVLVSQGRLDEAIHHYNKALRIDPGDEKTHCNMGTALASLGRLEEAIGHYNEALRIKPEYAKAHNYLGHVLASKGKYDEAIGHYNEALRINPGFTEALRNLRSAIEKSRNGTGAIDTP